MHASLLGGTQEKTGKSFGGNPVNIIMQASDSGVRYQDKPAECPRVERAIALLQ